MITGKPFAIVAIFQKRDQLSPFSREREKGGGKYRVEVLEPKR